MLTAFSPSDKRAPTERSLCRPASSADSFTGEKPSFGNVYTGTFLDRQPVSGSQLDDGIFQELMNSALLQAAEEIYGQFRPGASPASGNTEE